MIATKNPPVPSGWMKVENEDQFKIERISDGSQFIWIPVEKNPANGTLDGRRFSEKFGRRNFCKESFCKERFNELLNEEILRQIKFVQEYGGFYVSNCLASQTEDGRIKFTESGTQWTGKVSEAVKLASSFEKTEAVKSHLLYGIEYDSMLYFREGRKDVSEWTQERFGNEFHVVRNGIRRLCYSGEYVAEHTGFRVALSIA